MGVHWWWWRFAILHLPRLTTDAYIVPRGGTTFLDQEVDCWKTLRLATGLRHAKQAGESSLGRVKISVTTSLLIYCRQTLQIAISLIIMCEVQLRPTKQRIIKAKLKARIMAAFTSLNKETLERLAGDS